MKRIAYLISIITLIAVLIILGIIVFWALAPVKQAELDLSLDILNEPIVGDKILLSLPTKVQEAQLANITMENDSTVIIPEYIIGQSNPRVMQIDIPNTIPPGRYKVFLKAIIPINPIKKVERVIASEEFEIKRQY